MKRIISLSLVTALMFATQSCKQEQPLNIVILADFSSSRDSTMDWYRQTITTGVMLKMTPRQRLVVLPIDYASETGSSEIFSVDYTPNRYENEYAGLQGADVEKQNHLDSVRVAISRFEPAFEEARRRRTKLHQGTDVIGALKAAKKYFRTDERNLVVILSDMEQVTDKTDLNFERNLNSPAEIERYLKRVEKIDLSGMDIIVLTGMQSDITPAKFNAVSGFWQKYVSQSGGHLIDYSSGAVAKLEDAVSH